MANTLVSINSNDHSISRAFELQVRGFLDYLRNELRQRIDCGSELEDHEIQDHLRKIASDAVDYYQLRWRLLGKRHV
jgi:hypothetical protein